MSNIIRNASMLAAKHHHGQFRKHFSGVPYIVHPARVAAFLMRDNQTDVMVAAAWCHDLLEDTECHPGNIAESIGVQGLELVLELTNPSKKFPDLPRAVKKAIDRDHASRMTPYAKAIKAADRIDNLLDAEECSDANWVKMYCEESILLDRALGGGIYNMGDVARRILKELT